MHLDTPGVDIRRIKMTGKTFELKGNKEMIRSLYILDGSGMLNDKTIEQDDFVIIDDGADLNFNVHNSGLDVFVFTVPVSTGYPTYAQRMMH